MSTSSENIPNVSFPGDVELPFKSAPYTLHTSDGKDGDLAVDWTVTHHPDRHRINPEVASLPARYRWRVVARMAVERHRTNRLRAGRGTPGPTGSGPVT